MDRLMDRSIFGCQVDRLKGVVGPCVRLNCTRVANDLVMWISRLRRARGGVDTFTAFVLQLANDIIHEYARHGPAGGAAFQ